ncbi:hypothetical protein GQ42DRAFT_91694, partial [Ramicandelaber brevisporus]
LNLAARASSPLTAIGAAAGGKSWASLVARRDAVAVNVGNTALPALEVDSGGLDGDDGGHVGSGVSAVAVVLWLGGTAAVEDVSSSDGRGSGSNGEDDSRNAHFLN